MRTIVSLTSAAGAATLAGGAGAAGAVMFVGTPDLSVAMVILAMSGLASALVAAMTSRRLIRDAGLLATLASQADVPVEAGDPLAEAVVDDSADPVAGQDLASLQRPWSAAELATIADQLHQARRRLAEARRRQREAERGRRELLAWLGHDLRAPVGALRMLAESLVDGVAEHPEEVQADLARRAEALGDLVEELFLLARLDAGTLPLHRQDTGVATLVAEVVDGLRPYAGRAGVHLRVEVPAELSVPADRARLGRVLANLVGNAVAASPAGTQVRVRALGTAGGVVVEIHDACGNPPVEAFRAALQGAPPGSGAPGQGAMPAGTPDPAGGAMPVGTPDPAGGARSAGGAGLGLHVAVRLTRAHGGRLELDPTETGCCVRLWLPAEPLPNR